MAKRKSKRFTPIIITAQEILAFQNNLAESFFHGADGRAVNVARYARMICDHAIIIAARRICGGPGEQADELASRSIDKMFSDPAIAKLLGESITDPRDKSEIEARLFGPCGGCSVAPSTVSSPILSSLMKVALPFVANLNGLRKRLPGSQSSGLDHESLASLLIDTLANSQKLRDLLPAEIERTNGGLLRETRSIAGHTAPATVRFDNGKDYRAVPVRPAGSKKPRRLRETADDAK